MIQVLYTNIIIIDNIINEMFSSTINSTNRTKKNMKVK